MPYIKRDRRWEMSLGSDPQNAGELNYAITCTVVDYWQKHGQSYQTVNDIIGALEGAKAEFQRRIVVPYEDQKIKENGDVY